VEYRLSEVGESLRPVIGSLKVWGDGYLARFAPNQVA